jgi:RNA polymerase sigma-70 factor, ECF subfamily
MTADALAAFNEHKSILFAIAYRMLGTVMDAEDMAQETFLRWQKCDHNSIDSPKAWLSTVITRLCINHLNSARVQRQEYVGPWLPEPLVIDPSPVPGENAQLSDSVSVALLVLLENLSPTERAVFVLRDVFNYEFREVSLIVEKSEANCRQLLSRAHQHLAARRPRFESSPEQQERLVEAFIRASTHGDAQELMEILTDDIRFVSDGGAETRALRRPVVGMENVLRFLIHEGPRQRPVISSYRRAVINGQPGFIAYSDGKPHAAVIFDIDHDRIRTIYLVVNPEKLQRLPPALPS